MPTYDQLNDEAAWQDEVAPPGLTMLGALLRSHWGAVGAEVWLRGNNEHLRGYHRSRRWIKESFYCTDRTYSITRTEGNRSGGNSNWVAALDLALPSAELQAACRRLDAACRAGQLNKITEWFGNLGGDGRVDGWDNIAKRPASADSSHLTHLHMSFDRGHSNDDHRDVFLILIGEMDVEQSDVREIWQNYVARNGKNMADNVGETWKATQDIKSLVEDFAVTPVNVAELAAALTPALTAALLPQFQAAAERAVRDVLGTLDNSTS